MKSSCITRLIYLLGFIFSVAVVYPQSPDTALPVTTLQGSDTSKPLLFYISGDGGWNKFSTTFIHALNARGYTVAGLDAREYFWHKKDAIRTAKDVSGLLTKRIKSGTVKSIVLVGYSFGADVMPFIVTRCGKEIREKITQVVLMSPSETTDFEVHITDLLGIGKGNGENVPAEINKILQPVLFVFGDKEDNFPFDKISIKNYKVNKLPGGHHYDGDPVAVCNIILPYIR